MGEIGRAVAIRLPLLEDLNGAVIRREARLGRADFAGRSGAGGLQFLQSVKVMLGLIAIDAGFVDLAGEGDAFFLGPAVLRCLVGGLRAFQRGQSRGHMRLCLAVIHSEQQLAGGDLVSFMDVECLDDAGKRGVGLEIDLRLGSPCRWWPRCC